MAAYDKRPCAKGCGKPLDPRGAHKHEATCDGSVKRTDGKRRTPAKRREPKAARKSKITNHQSQIGGACLFCGGKDQALAKDLVARLIRGGMGFDVATELARDVVALVGK